MARNKIASAGRLLSQRSEGAPALQNYLAGVVFVDGEIRSFVLDQLVAVTIAPIAMWYRPPPCNVSGNQAM